MSGANASRWASKLAAIDANQLVALDALIQEASVTRAAHRVGITQSAMSQALGRLRHQFDDPILVRVGRHMEPTPFAIRIKPGLREAIAALEVVVRERPGFDPSTASNRFVLAMADYPALLLLPPLSQAIQDRVPHGALAVHGVAPGSLAPMLEAGTADLYVGVRGATEQGLQTASLFRDPFAVLMRRGHPLASKRITPQAYVRYPHVHVSPRREPSSIVERELAKLGLAREVAIEVPYFALVPGLLLDSDLLATVPATIAQHFATQHDLVSRASPAPPPALDICMAWHPRVAQQPALTWLRDLVQELTEHQRVPLRGSGR